MANFTGQMINNGGERKGRAVFCVSKEIRVNFLQELEFVQCINHS